ncbi:MAG: ATP-binding protein [Clostridia bacterium]|nr:ATP-binding protein [Clostridia bacterium]
MNSSDIIISLLGDSGKKQWLRSDILDILSEALKIDKGEANGRLTPFISRTSFLEKISDTPVKFKFSTTGEARYASIQTEKRGNETFRTDVGEFIKIYYWNAFCDCVMNQTEILEINYNDLVKGLKHIAEGLAGNDPDEYVQKLNKALHDIDVPTTEEFRPIVSIFNFGDTLKVEEVRTKHIGKFVEVEGRIVDTMIPRMKITLGAFRCQRCDHITYIQQEDRKYTEPFECDNSVCGRKGPFKLLDHPESEQVDYQEMLIESLSGGQVVVSVSAYGTLCRPPWERDAKVVRICGIVRKAQLATKTGKTNLFEWVIDASSIKFSDDSNTEPPTADEIKKFEDWAKQPHELRKMLLESIAPNIEGATEIKDACSLSLFSDWNWGSDPDLVMERSSIHVLLFGDPGVAKSQIIKDIVYLAPKGKFGQVTNMTRGGLSTVAVMENGAWHVKSGFFSQGDQGVVALDEIDKVHDPQDLNCLVSVLNEQIQHVSKAGQNDLKFNTRTAVLGAANPVKGGYLKTGEIMTQLESTIPSYIYQRFDVIFVIKDVPNKEKDSIVADNINKMHNDPTQSRKAIPRTISPDMFRKYVIYARTKSVPEFEPSAQKLIKDYYLTIRGISGDYPIISARQVSNINRLSKAIARREMARKVTEEHVKYAIGIMKASLSTLSDDQDYGIYSSGRTKSQVEKITMIKNAIKEICKKELSASTNDIAFVSGLDVMQIEHTLMMLERSREIFKAKGGFRLV